MRAKMKKSKDSKVFRRTAVKSKNINLGVKSYRGGVRL